MKKILFGILLMTSCKTHEKYYKVTILGIGDGCCRKGHIGEGIGSLVCSNGMVVEHAANYIVDTAVVCLEQDE